MEPQNTVLKEKALEWDRMLDGYRLPGWDDFPLLPLYMDQVIYLINRYLSPLPREEEQKGVTPAMINNYVKLGIIPRPVKKRYGRVHLAFLIMVCVLKQTVSTAEIKKLIPACMEEEEIKTLYGCFSAVFQEAKNSFRENVGRDAALVFGADGPSVSSLVFRTAVISGLAQDWTKQMLSLYREADQKNQPLPE